MEDGARFSVPVTEKVDRNRTNAMHRTTPKRVVSKADYRRYLLRKAGLLAVARIPWLFSAGALLILVAAVLLHANWPAALGAYAMYAFGFYALTSHFSRRAQNKLKRLEAVEPISRHNVGRLDPAEALVRGSEAPQTPETILLRAASTTPETPQEQLLRPTE